MVPTERLPPGHQMIPREFVDQHKRERVLRGVAEIVCEVGPSRMTVSLITSRARVARGTFYDLFDSRDDAFRSAVELASYRLRLAIGAAADRDGPWHERIGPIFSALIAAAIEEPPLAQLCLVHGYAGVGSGSPIDTALVDALASALRSGRRELAGDGPPPRTEELIAYGTLSVLGKRLRRGEADTLEGLDEDLARLATAPFCPPTAAP